MSTKQDYHLNDEENEDENEVLNLESNDEGEEEELVLAPNQRKIYCIPQDLSISGFVTMHANQELKLQPLYQRNFVINKKIASRLIESILLDVPIPVVYLAEEKDGTLSVIDGQQRLTSFISFVNGNFPNSNEFKLTGLKIMTELNKKTFAQLESPLQRKIKNSTIRSMIVKNESNEDIKFEIFERLNTGSVKLNEDEIRNTVYRGNYINLLAELAEDKTFHELVANEKSKNRMTYRGMILRFFALSERTYINYKSSMKQFCNKELINNRNILPEKSNEYKERFKRCVSLVKVVYGSNEAFRRYIPGKLSEDGESHEPGKWATSPINMALFDLQMVGFVNYTQNQVLQHKDAIREGLLDLMASNLEFEQLIGYKTSDTENVKRRFKIYMNMLETVITTSKDNPRLFPASLKHELFNEEPICAISGQRILAIEDAEVDHIKPFSEGGKTEKSNAQLVLRYFNRAKGNRES